ncbi:MAG: LTA synthase family protein [Ferruginibacter sp.]|nr:LTA synthase family protein [Bacteroidota bacterium]MBX2919975.1 LTA synthase family protein [Ferruginibacter sp.]MCB0708825.1 LTA synthase family protein [Chitinophagaceae bacterium]
MKFKFLPVTGKLVWQNNKAFILFVLCLLLLHSVLKIIFYNYNYHLLFNGQEASLSFTEKLKMAKWSLFTDLMVVLGINVVFLFALIIARLINKNISKWIIAPVFTIINFFAVLLNLVDVFYFRFHFQRTTADLLYVVGHPLERLLQQNLFIIILFFILLAGILCLLWVLHKKLLTAFNKGAYGYGIALMLLVCLICVFTLPSKYFSKRLLPAYPMLQLNSNELPFVQNSFHTFLYSVFRDGGQVPATAFMRDAVCDSLLPLKKFVVANETQGNKKNIVLFIMESVPYDFFDTTSAFKVAMPFFDSLLQESRFYNNAYCYAHESNKGITAILAGIPTATEIPVYHSSYINMPLTHIGQALHQLNYTSLFCIGDEYDNFGFAKCMKWLGIDKYYSKESIAGYKKLPAHSMGLQDEYVLNFFNSKLKEQQQPFLGIQYNISTHYPYDLPGSFALAMPKNYTAPMKSMRYYDYCLQKFFDAAKKESWFKNTVFIFCSDHWMFPEGVKGTYHAVSSYKIPIIIFDASKRDKQVIETPVSQFDILGTILSIAGYSNKIISYGNNLLETGSLKPYTFMKPNNEIYQVIDSSFVLGYNMVLNKPEYLYHFKNNVTENINLITEKNYENQRVSLTRLVQAFIQQMGKQYNNTSYK